MHSDAKTTEPVAADGCYGFCPVWFDDCARERQAATRREFAKCAGGADRARTHLPPQVIEQVSSWAGMLTK